MSRDGLNTKLASRMGNKCMRHAPENDRFQPLANVKHDKGDEIAVDWDNEKSVHHRSAINSLHNYALGKMGHLEADKSKLQSSPQKNGSRRLWTGTTTVQRSGSQSISFADELHQTIHFERHSMSMDFDRTFLENTGLSATPPHADQQDGDRQSPLPLSPTTSEFVACDPSSAPCKAAGGVPRRRLELSALPRFPHPAEAPSDATGLLRIE